MKPVLLGLLLSTLVIASATEARAQARHERVQISEMKSGGKVVGARIKLTLRSEGQSWKDVLIGIGPSNGINNSSNISTYRKLASDASAGHLLHQFPAIAKPGQTQEVTLEVKYADVPQLQPGQPIQIISAWRPTSGSAIHAWGLTRYGITETTYKLPGKANAQQQQLARRTSKRAVTKSTKAAPRTPKQHTLKAQSPVRSGRPADPRFSGAKPTLEASSKTMRTRALNQSADKRARAARKSAPRRVKPAR